MKTTTIDFAEIVTGFIENAQVSPISKKLYFTVCRMFYRYYTDVLKLDFIQLRPSHLIQWKNSIQDKSTLTITTYVTVVKLLFKYIEDNEMGENLAKNLKRPAKYRGYRKYPLTIDQVKSLLAAPDRDTLAGKRDFAILTLLVRNGLRVAEVQAITFQDYTTPVSGMTGFYLKRKGHKEKDVFVPLSVKGQLALKEYVDALPLLPEENPVFVSLSKNNYLKKLDPKSLSAIVKRYLGSVGLTSKYYTAHSLRHTAGVLALKNEAGEYATQVYLGHANFSTTQLYTRLLEQEMLTKKNPAFLTDGIY